MNIVGPKRWQYPLRLPFDRGALVEALAQQEHRSVNQQLFQLIEEALALRGRQVEKVKGGKP